MELSWLMKTRIAASVATGFVLIGLLAWPLAAPPEPFGTVSLTAGAISAPGAVILVVLAFLAGFIGFFVSWPYGREIGIMAAPAGLTIWAIRSGSMVDLIRRTNAAKQHALLSALKWEPLFWLAIVAAGFAGVLVAQKITSKYITEKSKIISNPKSNVRINVIIALVASVLIAQFGITVFAQDVRVFDDKLGSVIAQPDVAQIVYAVFIAFGIAAFVAKKFLNVSYIWPTVAGAFVTAFAVITHGQQDIIQHLNSSWPAIFFSHAVISILPIQIVAVGTLGSIAGFWMAIRYNYWRKHA